MSDALISYMEDRGVRPTPVRILTLQQFYKAPNARSLSELQILLDTVDKATIYRTLKTFEKHGILHTIDTNGDARYALCSSLCLPEQHTHTHPHFVCEKCDATYCLDKTRVAIDNFPRDHSANDIAVIIKGICPSCIGNR